MILHAEIIPHGRFEFDFFNRRNLQVFRRKNQFQIRRTVGVGDDLKFTAIMVGSLLCVEQVALKLRRSVDGNSNGVDGLRAVRIGLLRLFCSVELFCVF